MTDAGKDPFSISIDDEIAVDSISLIDKSDVGGRLRAAREKAGVSSILAAEELCIREDYLLALENGRYTDLPGLPYSIGFVRSYANYLELDSEQLVQNFKSEAKDRDEKPDLYFPTPVKQGRLPGSALVLFSLILGAAAYGGWYYYTTSIDRAAAGPDTVAGPETAGNKTTTVAKAPGNAPSNSDTTGATKGTTGDAPKSNTDSTSKSTAAKSTPAKSTGAKKTADPNANKTAETPAGKTPAGKTNTKSANNSASKSKTSPEAKTAKVPNISDVGAKVSPAKKAIAPIVKITASAGAVAGTADSDTSKAASVVLPAIVLKASGLTWIRIRDAEKKEIVSRMLSNGASFKVPQKSGLVMDVGRGNKLEIIVDGKSLGPLRQASVPVYRVPLDAKQLAKGGKQ